MNIVYKILFSIVIGGVFFYLASKDIRFEQLSWKSSYNSWYLIVLFSINFTIITILRAYRLYLILKRNGKIQIKDVVVYTFVGYLFIVVLPLRLGELILPYLVNKDTNISLTSTLSSVMFVRFVDLFVVMLLLIFVFFNVVVPDWLLKSNIIFISFIIIGSIAFLIFYKHSHLVWKLLLPILNFFPDRIHHSIKEILKGFKRGFEVIKDIKTVSVIMVLSFVIIFLSSFSISFLLNFLSMSDDFFISLTVAVINLIGISLPAGPGMIGNFQYSCMLALELFQFDNNSSFIFSNLYYIMGTGLTIIGGIIFLPTINFSFKELKILLQDKISKISNKQ